MPSKMPLSLPKGLATSQHLLHGCGPTRGPPASAGAESPGDQHHLPKAEPPAQPLTPIWLGLVTPNKCENATFAGRNLKEIGNLLLAPFPLSSHVCCYFLTLFFFS